MRFSFFKNTLIILLLVTVVGCFSCGSQNSSEKLESSTVLQEQEKQNKQDRVLLNNQIITGADQISEFLTLLMNKKVGVVVNQTSIVKTIQNSETLQKNVGENSFTHLIDVLLSKKVTVKKVFAPEHGFRGEADAGELIKDGLDMKTKLPIISLYGKNKKPNPKQLEDIDIMLFDIQDVGARFYTYISTLHLVMEACAEQNIPLIVLDRPNPNGHYIDGPVLEPQHSSFIGMHPVPVVHGMTIGEYAQMINGEHWLDNQIKCVLNVVKMKNYNHKAPYSLPINPSPNLPNDTAINLYPSLCFFEGTTISAGRGTSYQFQIFGAPKLSVQHFPFQFTPQPNKGAKHPKFKGEKCYGLDLRNVKKQNRLNLQWLIDAYVSYGKTPDFFNSFFTKLAGTKKLQKQIEKGYTFKEIRETWRKDLETYNRMRQKYLLYN